MDLPLRQWLGPATGISDEVLRNSVSAWRCVHILQVCHLRPAPPPGRQEANMQ